MKVIFKGHFFIYSLLATCLLFGVSPVQAVEPEPNSGIDDNYRLAGTVKGLAGKLVVELDDGEIVKITGDGSFKFKRGFSLGEDYSVKIKTPAANHLCEINNGQGLVAADVKVQIDVVCRQTGKWNHPVLPGDNISPEGQNAAVPVAALDGLGNAIIVWSQYDGKFWRILKSEYRENKWQNPGSLKDAISPGNSDARNPKVAMAGNGDIVIVWEQGRGKNRRICKAEYRKGRWTLPKSSTDFISIGDTNAFGGDLAMDDLGNTIIVWTQQSTKSEYQIYKSEYRGGLWRHPESLKEAISVPSNDTALSPKVVMNNRGEALITWQQTINRQDEIFKSEYRNNSWLHPKSIDDYLSPKNKAGAAYSPLPVLDDSGRAIITWQQIQGAKSFIYMSEFDGSARTKPQLSKAISSITGDNNFAKANSIAMDSKGNAIILWSVMKDFGQVLYMSDFMGGKWRHPARKDTFTGSKINYLPFPFAKVAMVDNGKAVVVWQHKGKDKISRVFMTEFDNGIWHLPGKQISVGDNQAGNVSIASAKNGSFLVVWEQSDGKNGQIYKSEFHLLKN